MYVISISAIMKFVNVEKESFAYNFMSINSVINSSTVHNLTFT